jgi:hypothetical protein
MNSLTRERERERERLLHFKEVFSKKTRSGLNARASTSAFFIRSYVEHPFFEAENKSVA